MEIHLPAPLRALEALNLETRSRLGLGLSSNWGTEQSFPPQNKKSTPGHLDVELFARGPKGVRLGIHASILLQP